MSYASSTRSQWMHRTWSCCSALPSSPGLNTADLKLLNYAAMCQQFGGPIDSAQAQPRHAGSKKLVQLGRNGMAGELLQFRQHKSTLPGVSPGFPDGRSNSLITNHQS